MELRATALYYTNDKYRRNRFKNRVGEKEKVKVDDVAHQNLWKGSKTQWEKGTIPQGKLPRGEVGG